MNADDSKRALPSDGKEFITCLKCRQQIKLSSTDLMNHIKTVHPEIKIIESEHQRGGYHTSTECVNGSCEKMAHPASQGTNLGFVPAPRKGCGYYNKESLQQEMLRRENENGARPEGGFFSEEPLQQEMLSRENAIASHNRQSMEEGIPLIVHTRRITPSTRKTSKKRKLYRTSIEKWRPANGTLYCPKCGIHKRPLIRTRTERFATNSCAAACLLGCWPFCFLPCLVSGGNNEEYLHCANCKTFLGLFDRRNNCIKPNKEYVEYLESARQQRNMVQSMNDIELGNEELPA